MHCIQYTIFGNGAQVVNSEILSEKFGSVVEITFNRPEQRNAMTWAMYARLVELCDEIDADPEVRVVLLKGAGEKAFVAGTDISQFTSFEGNPEAGIEYEARIDGVIGRLEQLTKPVIAAVRGFCVGGGLVIAAASDIRVVADDAKFGIPCVKLGNCLSLNNYARLVSLVGMARAKEMVYTGRLVPAQEAQAVGLVHEVVPAGLLLERARELATQIAAAAPLTIQVTKEAMRRLGHGIPSTANGADLIARCYNSTDFQEGVAAFLGKRRPVWQGW
jgi:enoyl-CoA hydratase